MPVWLQIVLPIVTAGVGFGLGRLGGALDRRRERRDTEAARAPVFEFTWVGGHRYRVMNVGDASASGIRLHFDDERFEAQNVVDMPDPVPALQPGESFTFMMVGTMGLPLPHQIRLFCDELPDGKPLPVPAPA
ncbi:hypothetical protein [Prauserella endophytica]|uniref:Uncharacterized protein n=1 Tax=Prauserella endophytica TaxID=1592324 RepID=A0ABY2RS25_9PSEU|nr:hypothetical protein [Prauserella endophytica]TKG57950.1 hypothetical protein FCN18_38550 [Prauserella endophytica]